MSVGPGNTISFARLQEHPQTLLCREVPKVYPRMSILFVLSFRTEKPTTLLGLSIVRINIGWFVRPLPSEVRDPMRGFRWSSLLSGKLGIVGIALRGMQRPWYKIYWSREEPSVGVLVDSGGVGLSALEGRNDFCGISRRRCVFWGYFQ